MLNLAHFSFVHFLIFKAILKIMPPMLTHGKILLSEKEIMRATNMAAKAFHYLVEPLQKEQAQIAA
ncbi:TPA: hypothetical protein F8V23_13970 [Legionella pneumophila]|nr:hypothetical protein [Legionella pneumophila]